MEALEIESKAEMSLSDMERQEFIDTITELKAMISSLKLTIDTLRQTISSQNATIASLQESMDRLQCAYDKAVKDRDELNNRMNRSNQETYCSKSLKQSNRSKIETCKNVGLNVKAYFTYVFRKLIEGEKDYEKLLSGTVAL